MGVGECKYLGAGAHLRTNVGEGALRGAHLCTNAGEGVQVLGWKCGGARAEGRWCRGVTISSQLCNSRVIAIG